MYKYVVAYGDELTKILYDEARFFETEEQAADYIAGHRAYITAVYGGQVVGDLPADLVGIYANRENRPTFIVQMAALFTPVDSPQEANKAPIALYKDARGWRNEAGQYVTVKH